MPSYNSRLIISAIRKVILNQRKIKINKTELKEIQNYIRRKVEYVLRYRDVDAEQMLFDELFSQGKWVKKNRVALQTLENEKLYKKFDIKAYWLLRTFKTRLNIVSSIGNLPIIEGEDGLGAIADSNKAGTIQRQNTKNQDGILDIVSQDALEKALAHSADPRYLKAYLIKKFASDPLMARFLAYSFPSTLFFKAIIFSVKDFQNLISLEFESREDLANTALKNEAAKLYKMDKEESKIAIREMRMFYKNYIVVPDSQRIRGYAAPSRNKLEVMRNTEKTKTLIKKIKNIFHENREK